MDGDRMKERKPDLVSVKDRPARPRPSERTTRAPSAFWDRIKFLLLLAILWFAGLAIVWTTSVNPIGGPFTDAIAIARHDYFWILVLAALELVRQLHYFFEEHFAGYYRFWEKTIWGGTRARAGRMDPWVRYRVSRALKAFIVLFALSTFLGRIFHTEPVWLGIVEAPARLVVALPFILQLGFAFFFVMFQFIGLFWFLSRGGIDTIQPDEIETRFEDVKGQDAALSQLKETLVYLENPDAIEARGGKVPGGILLWGPPGTGKTMMAKAIAGETGKPFVAVEPAAFIQMFMGVGALKVKGLYRKLRRLSLRHGGVLVFFDEADSLGSRGATAGTGLEPSVGPWSTEPGCNGIAYLSDPGRNAVFAAAVPQAPGPNKEGVLMGGMMGGGGAGTLQVLLSEMSGLDKPRGLVNRIRRALGMKPKPPPKYRILHIFATNMPESLDPAMLRPGRVDRQYKIGYPQKQGRKETFERYLGKVNNNVSPEELDKLATITPYFSGAMIEDIVNEGLVIAIRDERETVTYADIAKAKQLKQHGLPDEHEYIERERHSVAVHEACHGVAAYRLRHHAVIDMATIERRGDVGGFVASIPPEDQFVEWRSEREVDVMTFLASLAGERLFFEGDHSTGVGGDMRGATAITTQALAYYAMGDTIASRSVNLASLRGSQTLETGADRALFDSEFGKAVDAKLQELYDKTWKLLEANRAEVLAVAHALEIHKTLTGDDVTAIMEGTVGPTADGRPYQDPVFRQMLEKYHAAVVRAHREHGGVGAPIPVPIPPMPAVAIAAWSSDAEHEPETADPGPARSIRPAGRDKNAMGPPPRPDGS
jgi:ATP-dependent Zn protease